MLVGSGWEEKPRSGFTKRGAARFGRPKGADAVSCRRQRIHSHHLHQHQKNRREAVFLLVGSGWEEKPRSGFTKRGAARFGRPFSCDRQSYGRSRERLWMKTTRSSMETMPSSTRLRSNRDRVSGLIDNREAMT